MSYSDQLEDVYLKIGLVGHDMMPHDFQEVAFAHHGAAPIQQGDEPVERQPWVIPFLIQ